MAENCKELPEECWELIFKCFPQDTFFEPLSLVCKQFLYLTNRLRYKLSVTNDTLTIHGNLTTLLNRFPHLKSLDFTNFHGNLTGLLLQIATCCLLKLEEIDVSGANKIPISVLKILSSNFKCLKVLKCSKVGVLQDHDFVAIANSMPNLEELDVSYPRASHGSGGLMIATDDGIMTLAINLKKLRIINISGNHFLTDKSLTCLSINCAFLEEIIVKDCTLITSSGILFLMRNSLYLNAISASGLEILGRNLVKALGSYSQSLCKLELCDSNVSDDFLRWLAKMHVRIKNLSLDNCAIFRNPALLFLVSTLQSLQHLSLCQTYFLTDEHIQELSPYLHNLVTIKLNNCFHLTISTVYTLVKSCPLLEDLEVEHTNLCSDDSSEELTKCTNLKSLNLTGNDIKDECLLRLASCFPNLEILNLASCFSLTEIGVTGVLDICPKLRNLTIPGNAKFSCIREGPELPKLEVLVAVNTSINDEGLAMIGKRCSGLLKLHLQGSAKVTKKGIVEVLSLCKRLREINLNGCHKIDDKILDWMVFTRPSLRKIVLPRYGFISESRRRLYLQHGCQV